MNPCFLPPLPLFSTPSKPPIPTNTSKMTLNSNTNNPEPYQKNRSSKLTDESQYDQVSRQMLSRSLSETDREYLSKVRDRLYGAASRKANESETQAIASLPDDIEAMEDMMFDRAPVNAGQVPLFGGWLDEQAAGRKAGKNASMSPIQSPDSLFANGMRLFNRGRYNDAVVLFQRACQTAGEHTRQGGQYSLWHAQALDAAGKRKSAQQLLEGLRLHNDVDVRKVAAELYFIMTAPLLELDQSAFLDIPPLDDSKQTNDYTKVLAGFRKSDAKHGTRKKPERYSIDWYLQKKRPPKVEDNSLVEVILLAGLIFCTLAFMIGHSPS